MPASDKSDDEFKALINEKENQIIRLEKMVNAYKNLSDMYNEELIDANRMLQAHEIVQEMMRKEKIEADKVIKAQEIVQEMMREEKIEADKVIKAHEIVQEMMREEKIEAERVIKAHENLQELTIIEKKEAAKLLEAQENVNLLSKKELIEKDKTMKLILKITREIGTILDIDFLLNNIVKSLIDTVNADHGILYIREYSKLLPKIFINIKNSSLGSAYFNFCQEIILNCAVSQKSTLLVNNKLKLEKVEICISSLAVPLIYQDNLLGVLYADTITGGKSLKSGDLSSAEIFAGQASISINNSLLYDKIKKKNRELLNLVNFKNEFLNRFSDHLLKPVAEVKDEIDKIKSSLYISGSERNSLIEALCMKIERIENIVQKTLSFGEMESSVNELFRDTINVKDFIEKTILPGYIPLISDKKLNLDLTFSLEFSNFTVNKSIIRVIFDELLSNAIMYNKPGGNITINGYIKDNYYLIDITDTGPGIQEEEKDKIFQQFYRGNGGIKWNERGAGLGLFLVKNALSYYGGDIKIDSTYRDGTKFTISFMYQ